MQQNSNEVAFRRFTRKQLLACDRMDLLLTHGTDSGKRLRAFILDAFDDMAGESGAENAEQFISICTEAFNDMEQDRAKA